MRLTTEKYVILQGPYHKLQWVFLLIYCPTMGGIFVVVFYSVLGIRHHVLGIFLADKFILWINKDYVTLKGKNDDS